MFGRLSRSLFGKRLGAVVVGLVVSVAVLVGLGGVASAESGDGSLSVGTGYAHAGVEDLIWATEHMGYESPADLQKTGVLVIRFILVALAGITEQECDRNYGDVFDPYGPHRWVTEWAAHEVEAVEWVADHYCISPAQAQAFGGTLFAFFAGLDAGANGTTAVRRDPPPDPSEQTIPGRPSGLVATAGNGQVALAWSAPASGAASYAVTYYDPALATVLPAAQVAFWKIPPGVVEPHIVGGGKVSNSDHPYQVALLTASDSSGFTAQFCSGTLVAPRWVVTAAHCVADKTAAGVDVGVGKDDLALIAAADRHVVSAINVHPSYDSATYANDIALLQLSTAVTSST
ncbi:MAG: trypsin-like serine protease, partial [Acidimicrobiales bacterium]|nr:trypsin-like serine protease [Acidimicrobiales bacterium]